MRRPPLALLLLVASVGSAASSAPLCRDNRGLFTPCTTAEVHARARTVRTRAPGEHEQQAVPAADPTAAPTARATASASTKPPLIATGKLCHDSKGRATPC